MSDQATARRNDRRNSSAITEQHSPTSSGTDLPGAEQTAESIGSWLERHARKGAIVAVRHARWQLYEYHLDQIVKLNPRSRRVQLAQHGTFDLTGQAGSGPKGYLTLMIPTADVVEAAAEGRTWQHGRPAFRRPLTAHERALVAQLRAAGNGSPDE